MLRHLQSREPNFAAAFADLCPGRKPKDADFARGVTEIIDDVIARGDEALLDLTARYDGWHPSTASDLFIGPERMGESLKRLDADLRAALEEAAQNIRAYHQVQYRASIAADRDIGQRTSPLQCVGIYAPGGKAAYPSSALMCGVPASVAGVERIVIVSPARNGEISEALLAAAALAGVSAVVKLGGAQAVAALAYGTDSISAVDKIFGPGNRYVTEAKRQVFGVVGVDLLAGPTEIAIIADDSASPDWLAADMLAQAEHDEAARVWLLSDSEELLKATEHSLGKQLESLPRAHIARAALESGGTLISVVNLAEAVELCNRIAPEHLQLCARDADSLLASVRHAGAIFVGQHNAEVFGDYCAGPSHVLPTAGSARFASPLGVFDFQKRSSVIASPPEEVAAMVDVAARIARAEGLEAHARAAELRAPADQ